jgi:hypothetical protein
MSFEVGGVLRKTKNKMFYNLENFFFFFSSC